MYVQCERCKTEYDFDDALVSERGTTVKCTNCAHQFRVKRASGGGQQDRWVVSTTTGQELVFTSLKELQRAIIARLVGRGDSLARGNAPPRVLGAIAALEPFFESAADASRAPSPAAENARKTNPRKPFSSRPPPVPGANSPALTPPPKRVRSEPPPARPRVDTLRPYGDLGAAADPKATMPETPTAAPFQLPQREIPGKTQQIVGAPPPDLESDPEPQTARQKSNLIPVAAIAPQAPPQRTLPPARPQLKSNPPPLPPVRPQAKSNPPPLARTAAMDQVPPRPPVPARASQNVAVARASIAERTSPLPPPTRPVRRVMASVDDEADALPISTTPRRLGGWIVALVLVGGMAIFGAYMGRSFLEKGVHASAAVQPLDQRAQQFLAAGDAALLQGDLDGAKEAFDKASALAEKDPRVLLPAARLATIRADVPWLKQRLLAPAGVEIPASAQGDLAANKSQLDDLSARAKKAADDAVAAAPDDPAGLRVKVDSLRISGDRDAARALVGRVATNASQPDTAYVLGALDLAELDPPWSVVLERLRTAAAGEAGLGRARAALVYALARSGNLPLARQELDRLSSLAHPPPLVAQLRAFIDGSQARASGDGGALATGSGTSAIPPSFDVNKLPTSANPTPGGGGGISGDPRTLTSQADAARQKKDYPRARMLYEAALAKNASDSEALAGLGDVSHDEKDMQGAESFYKKAIAVNPTFLPALIGLADATWDLGDHAGAQKQYKDITDRFPEGSYPGRVKQRASDAAPPPTPTADPTASAAP